MLEGMVFSSHHSGLVLVLFWFSSSTFLVSLPSLLCFYSIISLFLFCLFFINFFFSRHRFKIIIIYTFLLNIIINFFLLIIIFNSVIFLNFFIYIILLNIINNFFLFIFLFLFNFLRNIFYLIINCIHFIRSSNYLNLLIFFNFYFYFFIFNFFFV